MANIEISDLPQRRINVVGTSGTGKSTFAARLAERLGVPYLQMDTLYWKPDWTPSTDEEFFPRLEAALQQEQWVLDGNFTITNELKWSYARLVIWLDFPFLLVMWRATRRALSRAVSGEEVWPGSGNVETFSRLFSRESVLWWTLKTFYLNRRKYAALMQSPPYDHLQFVRLRSPKEAERFLEACSLQARGNDPKEAPLIQDS